MIGSLRGKLLDRFSDGEALIEVAGVGYRVVVTPTTAVSLGDLGDEVMVHTHHHFREDDQTLYGFLSREERVVFEALIAAHGVGPALGLAILSVHGPADLQQVLADNDVAALCLVPGVGKKTAERLLLELKSRLDIPDIDLSAVTADNGEVPAVRSEVREALIGLGYGPDEIRNVLADLPDGGDTALLLKEALRRLAVT